MWDATAPRAPFPPPSLYHIAMSIYNTGLLKLQAIFTNTLRITAKYCVLLLLLILFPLLSDDAILCFGEPGCRFLNNSVADICSSFYEKQDSFNFTHTNILWIIDPLLSRYSLNSSRC
jgi:hypothetical protein